MNTRIKWTQLISVAVLVALASVFVTGPVAAVPGIPLPVAVDVPPVGMDFTTRARFEQYNEALSQMERDINATESNPLDVSGKGSQARFEQYLAAIAQMERDHNAAVLITGLSSRTAFGQYQTALEQMEREHDAALAELIAERESSRVRFEQYLEYAR